MKRIAILLLLTSIPMLAQPQPAGGPLMKPLTSEEIEVIRQRIQSALDRNTTIIDGSKNPQQIPLAITMRNFLDDIREGRQNVSRLGLDSELFNNLAAVEAKFKAKLAAKPVLDCKGGENYLDAHSTGHVLAQRIGKDKIESDKFYLGIFKALSRKQRKVVKKELRKIASSMMTASLDYDQLSIEAPEMFTGLMLQGCSRPDDGDDPLLADDLYHGGGKRT